jgi:hypothetical protein
MMTSLAVPASLRHFLVPLQAPACMDTRTTFGLSAPLLLVGHPDDNLCRAMNFAWENDIPIVHLDLVALAVPPFAGIAGSFEAVIKLCERQPCIVYATGIDEPRSMLVQREVEKGMAKLIAEGRNIEIICAVEADVIRSDAGLSFAGMHVM